MDAHGNFNTPETTPSGNVYGMTLAAITGRGIPLLTNFAGEAPIIKDEAAVLIGVRKLDPLEKENLKQSKDSVFTIKEIDKLGISEVMTRTIEIVTGKDNERSFHFSLDVDCIEPSVAPGTETIVSGD